MGPVQRPGRAGSGHLPRGTSRREPEEGYRVGCNQNPPADITPIGAPDPRAGWNRYANSEYGFSIDLPPGWVVYACDHPLDVQPGIDDPVELSLGYRRLSEGINITRTGTGAGDFILRGNLLVLDQIITKYALVYKGKDKALFYHNATEFGAGELVFTLSLDIDESIPQYADLALPGDLIPLFDEVVKSLKVIKAGSTPTPTPTLKPPLVTAVPTASYGPTPFVATLVSPDGVWVAEYRMGEINVGTPQPAPGPPIQPDGPAIYHQLFTIYRLDRTKTWTVEDSSFHGLGYTYPELLDWSQDSQHRYFRHNIAGKCEFFENTSGLSQFDVVTGELEQLELEAGSEHMVSPHERQMAFVGPGTPLRLSIVDLQTHTRRQVDIPQPGAGTQGWTAGNIVWSPDSQALVITIASDDMCEIKPLMFWLARLDLDTLQWTLLIKDSPAYITDKRWPIPGKIWLNTWQGSFWIDARTGEMTTAPG